MLHRLRQQSQTPALVVLAALLLCVLFGCLQHQLNLPKPAVTHHEHHQMHQGEMPDPAPQVSGCHQKADCSLEHGQTSTFDWQPLDLPFVLIALLPLACMAFAILHQESLRHNPREGPPYSGYPPTYLTLQVLRN